MKGWFGLQEDMTGTYLHYSLCNLRAIKMFLTGQIELMAFKIQVVCAEAVLTYCW
jgi:hypothetical protein